jgi:archaellum biogenesis ATPase FlaH
MVANGRNIIFATEPKRVQKKHISDIESIAMSIIKCNIKPFTGSSSVL